MFIFEYIYSESEYTLTKKKYGKKLIIIFKIPKPNSTLPVLVWIHGGGFLNGHGSYIIFSPHLLMDFNIIVVSINYRLGPFGIKN